MFRLLRFVVWTLTIIAWLPIFTIRNVCAQATSTNEVRDEDQFDDRAVADRYEQILRSRPQLGSAFDKLFAFHARQKTTAELCARLELTANSSQDGKLFQLLGLFQLRLGLRVDAVSNLTRAELLLPNEPLTSVYLSRALSANRQYAAALAALKVAAERKPNQAIALEMLKELRQLEGRGVDIEVVMELLANLEQQFSSSSTVIDKLADCLVDFGRPEAARPVFEKLIEITRDPLRRIELRIQLAKLTKHLGEPEQSLKQLEQLVGQVKQPSWLHRSLLEQIEELTEELHGTEGLIAYYEGVLLKQPDDVASMLRLAKSLGKGSRLEEARNWVSRGIEAAPEQPETLLAMADLMEESKFFSDASKIMQRLVQLDPTNADYIVRWGRLEALSPDASLNTGIPNTDIALHQSNAAAIWRRLLIGRENEPNKAIQVADLLRSISLSDEALKLYEQAVQVSGGKVEYRELLGEYLLQIDRREEAQQVFSSALSAAGDDRDRLIQLSEALMRFNFPDQALTALERACAKRAEFHELIRLANMQSESDRFEDALNTLNRAATMAESSADLTTVWDTQTRAFRMVSQLPEKIVSVENTRQKGSLNSIDALQRLAIMQAANNQQTKAVATALEGASLRPDSMRAWLLTARMQHDAGLSLSEIESLHVLCKLDAKHAADYLQRIATVHFQLNQVEEALDTLEHIFRLPTATLQHFQMAASYCLQSKRIERAVEVLRRAAQHFPRDRSAWLMLTQQLAQLRSNAQSIDAAWQVLELSHDLIQQREAVELLASLHPGEAGIATLLSDLRQFGIEHEQESNASLWSAWVMLDSGSIQGSSELITNLQKRSESRPVMLRAAVELSMRAGDYLHAIAIQQRLFREDGTVGNQLKLGQLLWQAGDFQGAEVEWKHVMRFRSNDDVVTLFAREMIDRSNCNMVAYLVKLGIESKIEDWELIALGIFANIQSKNLDKAAELSEKLLAMNLPLAAIVKLTSTNAIRKDAVPLTATDRLAWLEHAGTWQSLLNVLDTTRAGYRTNQTNPRASQAAVVRHLAIQRGASLRAAPMAKFNVQCFAEARAMAVLAKFGRVNHQSEGAVNEWASYIADAIESEDVDQLWDCVLVMEPSRNRQLAFTASGSIEYAEDAKDLTSRRYVEVLDVLVALDETAAVELAINEIVLRRQLQHQLASRLLQTVPVMEAKEFARLQNLVQHVDGSDAKSLAGKVVLAVELIRLQCLAEGQQTLESALASVSDISKLATCSRQFISNDEATQQAISRILLRAFELELETRNESGELALAISSFRTCATGPKSQDLLFEMMRLQAKHIEGLAAGQVFSDSRTNESRRAYRNFRKPPSAIADRSSLLSTSLRAALIDSTPDELTRLVSLMQPENVDSPTETAVRWFTASVAQSILNAPDRALALLKQAKEQNVASEIIGLYEVWLLVFNQRLAEASDALETIEPPNEAILRECELWKMDLGTKLGKKAESQRAARVLASLPLSVHESAEVAAVLIK